MSAPRPAEVRQFPCQGCGAAMHYSPETQALRCAHCGSQQPIPVDNQPIREIPLDAVPPVGRLTRYTYACQGCGAHIQSTETALRCQFCSAALVLDPTFSEQFLPQSILPFTVTRDQLSAILQTALKQHLPPTELAELAYRDTTQSTYVPYWHYTARAFVDYQGWYGPQDGPRHPLQGRSPLFELRDPLSIACRYMTKDEGSSPYTWYMDRLVPFRPEYLAGHHALPPDIDQREALQVTMPLGVQRRLNTAFADYLRKLLNGTPYTIANRNDDFSPTTAKLTLVPLWVAHYAYKGKDYRLFVHGQEGDVLNRTPPGPLGLGCTLTLFALLAGVVALLIWFLIAR
ncbi:hypothetical protein [Amycolatopsis methanolica]|uniref:hypothetical protein n=1 Tax=Amycolatopsis methanolica TaxID=1814 RepID=UPI003444C9AE